MFNYISHVIFNVGYNILAILNTYATDENVQIVKNLKYIICSH